MVAKLCTPPRDCYTGKMLFANVSKIITNWFLTLQPDIFKTISSLPQWAQERTWLFFYELIYAHLCQRKKSFIKIPILNLYLKL